MKSFNQVPVEEKVEDPLPSLVGKQCGKELWQSTRGINLGQ